MSATFRMRFTEFNQCFTTISVWRNKDVRPVQFTGDGYWNWGLGMTNNDVDALHLRNHGKNTCWAQKLHDALEGWHSCVLHQFEGDLFILPTHPDHAAVEALWDEAQATTKF